MAQVPRPLYEFGEFRLDAAERLLLRDGETLSLTPKIFDTLLLLVEDHGRLIKKDEFMERLWPGTYVSEDTLAHNISVIRKLLGDGTNGQTFIATVPKVGYRFVASVRVLGQDSGEKKFAEVSPGGRGPLPGEKAGLARNSGAIPGVSLAGPPAREGSLPARSSGFRLAATAPVTVALVAGFAIGFVVFNAFSPTPAPKVVGLTRITHSGRIDPWGKLVSDGSRIYFLEREGDHWNLTQTSVSGGETQVVAAPFRNTLLLDLSPDRSEFLAASFVYRTTEMPLWTWPVQGGAPTRIGQLTAYDAAWHPNGRQIIYSKDDGVFIADRDGSNPSKLAATRGHAGCFVWSPDGRLLRFSNFGPDMPSTSLWEVNADGSHFRQLLQSWSNPPVERCGSWSPDGSYFFFGSNHAESEDLWSLQEKGSPLRRGYANPLRLTAGPDLSGPPLVSSDGRRLFAIGSDLKAELVSYERGSRQFTPVLPGSRADYATYSRDGEWIAYVTIPDSVLWRIKRDGSLRSPITSPPIRATSPAWSPDAKQIAFVNGSPTCENKVYLVSAEGGTPRELFPNECGQFHPSWSPDGKFLTFARRLPSGASMATTIQLLDLATHRLSTLAGSQGMVAPSWSPDGRFIAAVTDDGHHLLVLDVGAQKWTELAQGTLINGRLGWSRDGDFLYFQDLLATNEAIYRIRLSNHRREDVVNCEGFIRAGVPRCSLTDLAPDGSLVVTLQRNNADIYRLDLSLP